MRETFKANMNKNKTRLLGGFFVYNRVCEAVVNIFIFIFNIN